MYCLVNIKNICAKYFHCGPIQFNYYINMLFFSRTNVQTMKVSSKCGIVIRCIRYFRFLYLKNNNIDIHVFFIKFLPFGCLSFSLVFISRMSFGCTILGLIKPQTKIFSAFKFPWTIPFSARIVIPFATYFINKTNM